MAGPVRARRLTDMEGQALQRLVRRGKHDSIRVRRALIIMASASGTPAPAIARLVAADEDTVRDVIHAFNERGLSCLDPNWAGGRPRRISQDDEAFIVEAAGTRPKKLGRPFTCWSLRKLADYLGNNPTRRVRIGRERLRQILHAHKITFQRTRTWKESSDPDFDTKCDRIDEVTTKFLDRCSRLTSSGHYRSDLTTAAPGRQRNGRIGFRRPTDAPTASDTSTAATAWLMISCGVWSGAAKAATTPWPPSNRSELPALMGHRST